MNQQLSLLMRAHMAILNKVRTFSDTPYEDRFRKAAHWVRLAMHAIRYGTGGEFAYMENASATLAAINSAIMADPAYIIVKAI